MGFTDLMMQNLNAIALICSRNYYTYRTREKYLWEPVEPAKRAITRQIQVTLGYVCYLNLVYFLLKNFSNSSGKKLSPAFKHKS